MLHCTAPFGSFPLLFGIMSIARKMMSQYINPHPSMLQKEQNDPNEAYHPRCGVMELVRTAEPVTSSRSPSSSRKTRVSLGEMAAHISCSTSSLPPTAACCRNRAIPRATDLLEMGTSDSDSPTMTESLWDLGVVAADAGGGRDMGVVGSIATVLPRRVGTCEVEQWVDVQCYIDRRGRSNVMTIYDRIFACQVCE